jgi:hypothetical protein
MRCQVFACARVAEFRCDAGFRHCEMLRNHRHNGAPARTFDVQQDGSPVWSRTGGTTA